MPSTDTVPQIRSESTRRCVLQIVDSVCSPVSTINRFRPGLECSRITILWVYRLATLMAELSV